MIKSGTQLPTWLSVDSLRSINLKNIKTCSVSIMWLFSVTAYGNVSLLYRFYGSDKHRWTQPDNRLKIFIVLAVKSSIRLQSHANVCKTPLHTHPFMAKGIMFLIWWFRFRLLWFIFHWRSTQITKFMGPTRGPPWSCRPQMGPMLAPWTLLSG